MELEFSGYVEKAREGDPEAFAKLYSIIYKELYYIALCNLGNSHDAADAVSEAVLDAYVSIGKLRDIVAFKAWMIKILTYKIKKKQTDYIAKRQNSSELDEDNSDISANDDEFGKLEIYEHINLLGESEKLVFSMIIVCGYSSEEISRITGMKSSTVRSHLLRGREKLKRMLAVE